MSPDGGPDARHDELARAVRRVLDDHARPDQVRAVVEDGAAWRPLWDRAVALGWPALGVPEDHGGLGMAAGDLAVLARECGRHLVPAPLVSTSVAVAAAGAGGGAGGPLGRVAAGVPATYADAGRSHDPLRLVGGRVVGTAARVPDAGRAALLAAFAHDGAGGRRLVVVEAGAAEPGSPAGPDPLRPLGDVRVDAVADAVVDADPAVALARARVVLAAELVGVAGRALELAVAHAREREQFGRPIGSFQGVKHPLASCWLACEQASALVSHAAGVVDAGPDPAADGGDAAAPAALAAAMAKAAANDAALATTKQGVQVLGALGTTWEHEMPWLLRRARQGASLLGDSRALHRTVGAALVDRHRASGRGASR